MLLHVAPYFGYLASFCLILALLAKNDIRFRLFSMTGCSCFIIYALIFKVWPVLITNSILFTINTYYFVVIFRHKEIFDLLEFSGEEKLVKRFTSFYQKDIAAYFPEFAHDQLKDNLNFAVIRDLVIANIFSVRVYENGDAEVIINYTVPKYRDYKVGKFIFEKEKQSLISKGIRRIIYKNVHNKKHAKFLSVNGFVNNKGQYLKMI